MKRLFLVLFFTVVTVSSVNAQSTLALQEKCATGAKKFFFEGGNKFLQKTEGGLWANNYQSHYSKNLDKCFILFITSYWPKHGDNAEDEPVLWFENLYDVFEGKSYGSFFRTQYKNFNWPVKECIVRDKICHSEAEFKTLIKPYMEE